MVHFRKANLDSEQDCLAILQWENDPEIRHLFCWFKDKESHDHLTTLNEVAHRKRNHPEDPSSEHWLILRDHQPIGEIKYNFDPPQIISNQPKTAWTSIVIGEKSEHGRGTGKHAMNFIEDRARINGALAFEIGAFEFNQIALKLYRKLGYHEIAKVPNFTYWNGKMWADIRMIKSTVDTPNPSL